MTSTTTTTATDEDHTITEEELLELDRLHAEAEAEAAKAEKPAEEVQADPETPTRKSRTDVTYYHDGKPMPGSHKHKLSTLAYFHSGGLIDGFPKRVPTKVFVAELAKAGIAEPLEPGWIVKLANGVTVECRLDGDPSQYDGPAPTRKPSTSKPASTRKASKPAKKATAKKATAPKPKKPVAKTAKKPAGLARAEKRTVTPIPKKVATKRSSRAN